MSGGLWGSSRLEGGSPHYLFTDWGVTISRHGAAGRGLRSWRWPRRPGQLWSRCLAVSWLCFGCILCPGCVIELGLVCVLAVSWLFPEAVSWSCILDLFPGCVLELQLCSGVGQAGGAAHWGCGGLGEQLPHAWKVTREG